VADENYWQVDSEINKETVLQAISTLSEKYQIVLKLYLIEGFDHQEISEVLSIPIKTSRTHFRRGKLQLQELLKTKRYESRS